MTLSVSAYVPRRQAAQADPEAVREREVRRRVTWVWCLLLLDALTYSPGIIPIPGFIGKGITQGAVTVALLLALSLNRHIVVRPNIFLCLATLLFLETVLTAAQPEHIGTVYRTFRLGEFIATLWLLTPWWGRRDMLLVRTHLNALGVVLASVLLGLLIDPGRAIAGGRLGGIIWSIAPTQVAHYAAMVTGLVTILWLCGQLPGKTTLWVVTFTGIILVLTHTRTALAGLIVGLFVSGLSLIVAKARVRRLFAAASVVASIAAVTLSGFLSTWLARGEGADELSNLTGRTLVWGPLVQFPRTTFQEIFGFGLSNASFNGLSIDSNWLASYQMQGLFGAVVCGVMVLFLLVAAVFQPRGPRRALALFIVTYCLVASFTEVAFTDASTYLLEMTLAASLIVPSAARSPSTYGS